MSVDTFDGRGPIMVVPARGQLNAGAVWITIANWADALGDRYGDVLIYTPEGIMTPTAARQDAFRPGTQASERKRPARLPGIKALAKDLRWAWRGVQFDIKARRGQMLPEVAPFVWQHHDLFQTAGLSLARRVGVPLVLFVDSPIVWEARKWGLARPGWGSLVERIGEVPLLRRADVVACVSAEVGDEVVRLGADPARVMVAPCSARPPVRAVTGHAVRARHGIGDAFVIGWVGSFRGFHSLDLLIDALTDPRLHGHRPCLLLVGDGPERSRLLSRCARAGIHVIAPGTVSHDEVYEYIAAFDCGIVTAVGGQGFHYSPLKLKEYMAVGTAVIAPRVGEMEAVLIDGVDAILYPPGDVDALAGRVAMALRSRAHLRRIGEAGRETFIRRFSMQSQIDELEGLLSFSSPDRTMAD